MDDKKLLPPQKRQGNGSQGKSNSRATVLSMVRNKISYSGSIVGGKMLKQMI